MVDDHGMESEEEFLVIPGDTTTVDDVDDDHDDNYDDGTRHLFRSSNGSHQQEEIASVLPSSLSSSKILFRILVTIVLVVLWFTIGWWSWNQTCSTWQKDSNNHNPTSFGINPIVLVSVVLILIQFLVPVGIVWLVQWIWKEYTRESEWSCSTNRHRRRQQQPQTNHITSDESSFYATECNRTEQENKDEEDNNHHGTNNSDGGDEENGSTTNASTQCTANPSITLTWFVLFLFGMALIGIGYLLSSWKNVAAKTTIKGLRFGFMLIWLTLYLPWGWSILHRSYVRTSLGQMGHSCWTRIIRTVSTTTTIPNRTSYATTTPNPPFHRAYCCLWSWWKSPCLVVVRLVTILGIWIVVSHIILMICTRDMIKMEKLYSHQHHLHDEQQGRQQQQPPDEQPRQVPVILLPSWFVEIWKDLCTMVIPTILLLVIATAIVMTIIEWTLESLSLSLYNDNSTTRRNRLVQYYRNQQWTSLWWWWSELKLSCLITSGLLGWTLFCFYDITELFPIDCIGRGQVDIACNDRNGQTSVISPSLLLAMALCLFLIGSMDPNIHTSIQQHDDDDGGRNSHNNRGTTITQHNSFAAAAATAATTTTSMTQRNRIVTTPVTAPASIPNEAEQWLWNMPFLKQCKVWLQGFACLGLAIYFLYGSMTMVRTYQTAASEWIMACFLGIGDLWIAWYIRQRISWTTLGARSTTTEPSNGSNINTTSGNSRVSNSENEQPHQDQQSFQQDLANDNVPLLGGDQGLVV